MAGITGYGKIHRNLFSDSNYPEVVPVEKELYTLDNIHRAYSSTIDEVTVICAEFEYVKDIDTAVNDVTNALSKIRSKLPSDIKEPQIIKITSATAPLPSLKPQPNEW